MSLERELHLRTPIKPLEREVLLNVYYTASCVKKKADEFFRQFGLSDVQFNVMMLLKHQSDPSQRDAGGLSQAQISEMMLVNPANITSLIDRMEKAHLVTRTTAPADRRSNIVTLTDYGSTLLAKVEPLYLQEIARTAVLSNAEQHELIAMLERLRQKLTMAVASAV